MQDYLKFSPGNAKLKDRGIAIFNLPAGYTCPGADQCYSKFDRTIRKVVDGPNLRFRCYAASSEARSPHLRALTDYNQKLLRDAGTEAGMTAVLKRSLPPAYFDKIRIHSDGDFFSLAYMKAWVNVIEENPHRLFYAYTKSIPHWLKLRDLLPPNLVLTASMGGLFDRDAEANGLRSATVVFHPDEAEQRGWEIDHDDSLAQSPTAPSFALLLHNTQPAGSEASKALSLMRKQGIVFSYSRNNDLRPDGHG